MTSYLFDFAYAYGKPDASAVIRVMPEDFQVVETIRFEPSGTGQHVYLSIRKRNTNTEWLAKELARFAGIKVMDVGYAGLKDRNAVTRQWLSVDLAGKPEPDWSLFNTDEYMIETVTRHNGKLRRTAVKENCFTLVLRELKGDTAALEQRLQEIRQHGVPNYFGEQRFGRNGNNLDVVDTLFSGERKMKRHQRGIYLSAARSYIFNQVLSRRVSDKNWNQPLAGDVMQLSGSHSCFLTEAVDAVIQQRIAEHDIAPTGPLWGRGKLQTAGEVQVLESEIASHYPLWQNGLEQAGMSQERRSLCIYPNEMAWSFDKENALTLTFGLPAGNYATSVLRELISYQEAGGSTGQDPAEEGL